MRGARCMKAVSIDPTRVTKCVLVIGLVLALFLPETPFAGSQYQPEAPALQHSTVISHPNFVSPHANPIAVHANKVFVVNTPSDSLDVIDARTHRVVARIAVGVDPVSVAVRPDGREIWVSNHVSDSVSVIDIAPGSPTYLQVVATVQDFDRQRKATSFDEPMGIAFADNDKAYVALSS
ncbi:MAG: hypothetical protein CBC17_004850, partial [Gammaproteobacteria bacterium TMED57]